MTPDGVDFPFLFFLNGTKQMVGDAAALTSQEAANLIVLTNLRMVFK